MSENKYRTMLERVANELGDPMGARWCENPAQDEHLLLSLRDDVLKVLDNEDVINQPANDNESVINSAKDWYDFEPPDNTALSHDNISWSTITFNLDDPEGERRLRECLDARKWKSAVWEFDNWLRNQIKYSEHAQAWIDALEQVRVDFNRIFYDHGVDIWED